ncbi:hypothetical protein [Fangia hongkongensis]|uniref:hypothetical protein n=1 Tax=Fangia hongkongensis TaxID=270495 RepID=UPI00035E194F|nr:hypothetical protein [Fangia hongkongensis]MBK2125517.1 hypothetical protein [Fangia hongkongensis]
MSKVIYIPRRCTATPKHIQLIKNYANRQHCKLEIHVLLQIAPYASIIHDFENTKHSFCQEWTKKIGQENCSFTIFDVTVFYFETVKQLLQQESTNCIIFDSRTNYFMTQCMRWKKKPKLIFSNDLLKGEDFGKQVTTKMS